MDDRIYHVASPDALPDTPGWLAAQPWPVIALGEYPSDSVPENADLLVATESELAQVTAAIEQSPQAALVLVQVLRSVHRLSVQEALTLESLAYATLQAGAEYRAWTADRAEPPQLIAGEEGDAVVMQRTGNTVHAALNRPGNRNAMTVEMRDALVNLFELVNADSDIEAVYLQGRGACFSVGGELREFGLAPDAATAHRVRSLHSPARLLAQVAHKVHVTVHSACIGSGIELPAFAARVSAAPNSFFQLPELGFGLIPGAGGCVSITRRIGRQRMAWLALTGRKIKAKTALDWGLIDAIVEPDTSGAGADQSAR